MTTKSTFFGTLDFLFDLSPGLIKRRTKTTLNTHFKKPVRTPGRSPFLMVRMAKAHRVVLRPYHIISEDAFVSFEDTSEPVQTQYVVQLHQADRAGRHFDVRIWYKGRAVSWAVPMKGKRDGWSRMPQAGERWAAIRQPDHSLEGFNFEGEILSGKGKGTVQMFARGTCDILKIEDGHVHVRFIDGAAQGDYVFVDTEKGGLVVGKDRGDALPWSKPRFKKGDVNHVCDFEETGSTVAESKRDGASVEVQVGKYGARVFSHRVSRRTGRYVEHTDRLPHLSYETVPGHEGTRLRGEAWHRRGVNFLSGTLNSGATRAREVQRQAGPVRIDAFDITHYRGEDVRDRPYAERRALYEQVCRDWDSPYVRPVRQVASGFKRFYYQQVALKSAPTDGIVIKELGETYDERPHIKLKPSDFRDCLVLGATEGNGRHRGRLGALTCRSPSGSDIQVGSGFTDWERAWVWNHRAEVLGDTARVEVHVRSGEPTDTGPRFHSWHPDKSECALRMYAETLDPKDPALIYKLIQQQVGDDDE